MGCRRPATSCAATIIPMQVPQNGMPARTRSLIGAPQREAIDQTDHGRRLAARHDERVDAREVGRRAHLDDARTGTLERARVLDDVALERQNADVHQTPRDARSWCSAS